MHMCSEPTAKRQAACGRLDEELATNEPTTHLQVHYACVRRKIWEAQNLGGLWIECVLDYCVCTTLVSTRAHPLIGLIRCALVQSLHGRSFRTIDA